MLLIFGNGLSLMCAQHFRTLRKSLYIYNLQACSLPDKTPVAELLTVIDYKDVKEQRTNQLSLNLFKVDGHESLCKIN